MHHIAPSVRLGDVLGYGGNVLGYLIIPYHTVIIMQ